MKRILRIVLISLLWAAPALAIEPGCIVNLTDSDIHGSIERQSTGLGFSQGDFTVESQGTWCRTLPEGDYEVVRRVGELEFVRGLRVSRQPPKNLGGRVRFLNGDLPGWLILYLPGDEL